MLFLSGIIDSNNFNRYVLVLLNAVKIYKQLFVSLKTFLHCLRIQLVTFWKKIQERERLLWLHNQLLLGCQMVLRITNGFQVPFKNGVLVLLPLLWLHTRAGGGANELHFCCIHKVCNNMAQGLYDTGCVSSRHKSK